MKNKLNIEEYGYTNDAVLYLCIRVWNIDHLRNKQIKITKNATSKQIDFNIQSRSYSTKHKNLSVIKPLTRIFKLENFICLDIETVLFNGKEIPATVGIVHNLLDHLTYESFILDPKLVTNNDSEGAEKVLWEKVFNYLINLSAKNPNVNLKNEC